MSEKPETAAGYAPEQTELVEQVLLEIWSRLGDFHGHLVLVGGLVPRYIVPQDTASVKHCGTLDLDLGVCLAVAGLEVYANMRKTLERIGLKPDVNERGNDRLHSFVMEYETKRVIVDFLTTKYEGPARVIRKVADELSAIQVEGLGLALKEPLAVTINGQRLKGGIVEAQIRVCRPIPFLVLKALAFAKRGEGKDVNDLVYVLQNYPGGPSGVAGLVRDEERDAESFKRSIEVLRRAFEGLGHDGPVQYSKFNPELDNAEAQALAAVREFLEARGAV